VKKYNFLFLLTACSFVILIMEGCRATKQINKAIGPKPVVIIENKMAEDSIRSLKENFNQFKSNKIDFRTFSAKIKVESVSANRKNPDLTAVVRIIKDSAIWISLSATLINVEVYRILITKDSVLLLNKQDKEVIQRTLSYLDEVTEIPFNYETLQDLIIGNPVFVSDSIISYKKTDATILFSTIETYFKNLLTVSSTDKLILRSKMDDIDNARSRTASIVYDGYETYQGRRFSTTRTISASEKNKIDLSLSFKQFEFDKELSVYMNIPKNYKKK